MNIQATVSSLMTQIGQGIRWALNSLVERVSALFRFAIGQVEPQTPILTTVEGASLVPPPVAIAVQDAVNRVEAENGILAGIEAAAVSAGVESPVIAERPLAARPLDDARTALLVGALDAQYVGEDMERGAALVVASKLTEASLGSVIGRAVPQYDKAMQEVIDTTRAQHAAIAATYLAKGKEVPEKFRYAMKSTVMRPASLGDDAAARIEIGKAKTAEGKDIVNPGYSTATAEDMINAALQAMLAVEIASGRVKHVPFSHQRSVLLVGASV
jgi:hypothetical protein